VRIVFLLLARPGEIESIEALFGLVTEIADDDRVRRDLARVRSYEEFVERILPIAE